MRRRAFLAGAISSLVKVARANHRIACSRLFENVR